MTTTLLQLAGGLYAASAAGGRAVFLLSGASAPPPTLPLADVWANIGPPSSPGWFVFLDTPVGPADGQGAETALRAVLPSTSGTGLAWLSYAAGRAVPVAIVATALDDQTRPTVAADVTVPVPVGQLAISFASGAPIRADAAIQRLVAGVPPGSNAPIAVGGPGVSVDLFGTLAGCIGFDALVGEAPAPGAVVALMRVLIDPLDPFDRTRNGETFTGVQFVFARAAERWHLVPQGNRTT